MSQTCEKIKTFTATEALEPFRRVKLTSGSGTAVEYADAGEDFIGVTERRADLGGQVPVRLKGAWSTFKIEAADSFAEQAALYGAADGKISDSASGTTCGTALEAASGDGSIVEAFLDNGDGAEVGPASAQNEAADVGALPIVLRKSCENATGGAVDITIATADRKLLIIDAYMIARDTQAANVKIVNDTTDVTTAKAKGTSDDAIVRFDDIIAEADEVAEGDDIVANFSADGAADIFVVCLPIA